MSFYRTTDDEREVTSEDYDLHFDYGFLYEKKKLIMIIYNKKYQSILRIDIDNFKRKWKGIYFYG